MITNLASGDPVPLLLLLLSAFDKVWDPGRESEVVRVVPGLLLLLLGAGVGALGLGAGHVAPHAAVAAVDAARVVARRQLRRTVTATAA